MTLKARIQSWKLTFSVRFRNMMKCMRSGEQLRVDDLAASSSESLATKDYSASGYSSRAAEVDSKLDNSNIEEAESSLRESGFLNYEEARALLGRLEYQKGNIEGALHVFEGIDIAAVTSRMKVALSKKLDHQNRRRSQSDPVPPMSMHAISLLLEAALLKAKSLQGLGRFSEASQSCKIILDTIESALPDGVSEQISADCKLQEILNKAVELLPELCKLAGAPEEAIVAYRRALLYYWNLDTETTARIQKEFAIFLLYSGTDAIPPTLRFQMEGSFVPRNNIEEAVLLLLILLRKFALRKIVWDPTIMDHLSFALSVTGELKALAYQVEELLPGTTERQERFCTLALCYHGEGDNEVALNLLRNFLKDRESKSCCTMELLLASKISAENSIHVDEGIAHVCRALCDPGRCVQIASLNNCLLGLLLSNKSRLVSSDSERLVKQSEAIEKLELAQRTMKEKDPYVIYNLALENAEQRKLDTALTYAKQVFRLEAGSSTRSYVLLARILSAQKRFVDAETVISAAIDQTGRWDHGELLRTKAKIQVAQGHLKSAIETYTHLLAILQVRTKNSGMEKKVHKTSRSSDRKLEMETWHDLANVYTSMSQWRDAEVCLSKSMVINPYSASRWHSTGVLYEAKGMHQEALKAYKAALDAEPAHVPSLISIACVLKCLGVNSLPVIKSFITDALRFDKLNHSAWYQLGLIYQADPSASAVDALECFEAAAMLEETAPVEPFR